MNLHYFNLLFTCLLASVSSLGRVNEDDITYVFYSRTYFLGVYAHTDDVPTFTNIRKVFNPRNPTVVLIHGWQDGYGADSNTFVRGAVLSKTDANIIKVDWSPLAGQNYLSAKNAVPSVGRFSGKFLRKLSNQFGYSLKNVTLVGFSLGAHIAGNIGKELNSKIGQIVALDPAGPFISSSDSDFSVSPSDAENVQVIHTNGGTLGMIDAVGHSDFYPNGGRKQPGCGADIFGGCAHNRAWEFFAESVSGDVNRFVSQRCNSYDEYRRNRCSGNFKLMGGLSLLDKTARGSYYLETNAASPFGRG